VPFLGRTRRRQKPFSPRRKFAIRSGDIEADRLHVRARGCYFGVLFVSAISDVSVFRSDDPSLQRQNLDVAFKVERKGSFVNLAISGDTSNQARQPVEKRHDGRDEEDDGFD
jgi:hypothetical protein